MSHISSTEILLPFLPDDPECLELFARSLVPGWTSWGNEVSMITVYLLSLFQRLIFFQAFEILPQETKV